MSAFLLVRAKVAPAERDAFDAWYQKEHLPDVANALDAANARRGWSAFSDVDDNGDFAIHFAIYEFADVADAKRAMGSDGYDRMVAEFDRCWQGRVTRTREVLDSVQTI